MIYEFLEAHAIPYERVDHPAVFTCAEAKQLVPNLAGAETKNLFLRDGSGKRHFLVSTPPAKSINLKQLSALLQIKGLGFASSERLKKYLGLEPGSVTLLGVLNDPKQEVEVIIDEELWTEQTFLCHPLVNTSTLVLSKESLVRFFNLTNHSPHVLKIPSKL